MGSVNELLALIVHRTLTSRGDEKLCVSYVVARPLTSSPNRLLPTTPPLTVTGRQRHERPAASSISHVDWHSADRGPGRPLPQPALSNGSGSRCIALTFQPPLSRGELLDDLRLPGYRSERLIRVTMESQSRFSVSL